MPTSPSASPATSMARAAGSHLASAANVATSAGRDAAPCRAARAVIASAPSPASRDATPPPIARQAARSRSSAIVPSAPARPRVAVPRHASQRPVTANSAGSAMTAGSASANETSGFFRSIPAPIQCVIRSAPPNPGSAPWPALPRSSRQARPVATCCRSRGRPGLHPGAGPGGFPRGRRRLCYFVAFERAVSLFPSGSRR